MEFTRQRKENELIIYSHKNRYLVMLAACITFFMWIYSFVIFYFFISAMGNFNSDFIRLVKIALKVTNKDIRSFMSISIIIFITQLVLMFSWKIYNKKRFGNLNRRSMPKYSSDEDILSLKLISEENYKILKSDKIVVFDKNPMEELNKGSN